MDKLTNIDFSRYEIRKNGEIYSKYFNRILGSKCPNGYTRVNLILKNGEKSDFLLHRVIAYIYCSIPEHLKHIPLEKLEVDHIIPLSEGGTNEASNLRWCTSSENSRNEITLSKNKEAQPKTPVLCTLKSTGEIIGEFESTNEAARVLKINQGNIYNCASGRCKSTKGYIFQFI